MSSDLRFALRQIRRHPGFALCTMLVLALGIAAGTAMFSVVDAVLLQSLPYPNAQQLVTVREPRGAARVFWGASHPDVLDWQRGQHSLQDLAFYQDDRRSLRGQSATSVVNAAEASSNLFAVLGVQPALGRGFSPAEMKQKAPVAVLSHDLWERWYRGDPGALGRTIATTKGDYTVIGVMPAGFRFPYDPNDAADLFLPYQADSPDLRDDIGLQVLGRLKSGVSVAGAQAELSGIQAGIARAYGKSELPARVVVTRYAEELTGDAAPPLEALAAAVGLVWLIACCSATGLLLARFAARRDELAVRAALGAGRGRIARQWLLEVFVLGLGGLAGGLALAEGSLLLLRHFLLTRLPFASDIHLSGLVWAVLAGLTLVTVLVVGAVPAWLAARAPAAEALRGAHASSGRAHARLRNGLVAGEIALALVLLAATGLLLRTLEHLRQVPLGYSTTNLLTARLTIPDGRYDHQSVYQALEQPLLQRVEALPGVESAAVSSILPLTRGVMVMGMLQIPGRRPDQQPQGDLRFTSPSYLQTMGMHMESGRFFNPAKDTPNSPLAMVVNHAFAAKYFPGQQIAGTEIPVFGKIHVTIIGVLADAHERNLNQAIAPVMHYSTSQLTPGSPFYNLGEQFVQLAVRTRADPDSEIGAIRATLHDLAPDVAVQKFSTMQQLVTDALGSQILAARLLGIFAVAALTIALTGLYGLLAQAVTQRRRELGIRMALGAERRQIQRLVLGQAAWLIGTGMAGGLAISLLAAGVLSAYLYRVPVRDPLTLMVVCALLAVCGLLAAWLPARWAAAVAPAEALRAD